VRDLLGIFNPNSDEGTAALLKLMGYFGEIVRERRASPTDDLFGELVRAHDADGNLTDDELIMFGTGLLVAGFEGTADQIADSIYVLLDQREQFDLLARDPSLAESAVEELLRYVPLGTAGVFPYTAKEDLELSGTRIKAGETVMPAILAANHDPTVFEDPGRLDICRKHNPHVAFGHGVHHCLGSQLARMELQVLFAKLPQRFPQLRLAVPADEIPWKSGLLMRGPHQLPVSW
jgi:cytochrome P450